MSVHVALPAEVFRVPVPDLARQQRSGRIHQDDAEVGSQEYDRTDEEDRPKGRYKVVTPAAAFPGAQALFEGLVPVLRVHFYPPVKAPTYFAHACLA